MPHTVAVVKVLYTWFCALETAVHVCSVHFQAGRTIMLTNALVTGWYQPGKTLL